MKTMTDNTFTSGLITQAIERAARAFITTSAVILLLFLTGCANKAQQQAPLNNVEYASVSSLAYQAFTHSHQYGTNENQRVYHWPAKHESTKHGSVFLIHGGCWLAQFDMTHTQALSSALAEEGFEVWNIEYRRAGNGGEWPVALHDIQSAINHVIDSDPSINLNKSAIVGHSAGGHLAMLAATDYQALGLQAQLKVVGLAPIVDVHNYSVGENSCQSATPLFMQGTVLEKPDIYDQASPLLHQFDSEKTIVMIGGKDKIVPPEYASHPNAQQYLVTEAGHFDWIHPQTAAFKQLLLVLKDEVSQ